uniref:Uncharacterized protein n=1 Tax=Glossina pallidipes TaxID=7398 RepID=A0A1B0A2E4_GLOPL
MQPFTYLPTHIRTILYTYPCFRILCSFLSGLLEKRAPVFAVHGPSKVYKDFAFVTSNMFSAFTIALLQFAMGHTVNLLDAFVTCKNVTITLRVKLDIPGQLAGVYNLTVF